MDCYIVIDNCGYVIQITDNFKRCAVDISIGCNLFEQIDHSNGKGEEFIKCIKSIDEMQQVFDITPLAQEMFASDGWKYLLVVAKNLGNNKVKCIIPSHQVSARLASIPFTEDKHDKKSRCHLKINTLIIDDSIVTCKSTCRLIEKKGHNVSSIL